MELIWRVKAKSEVKDDSGQYGELAERRRVFMVPAGGGWAKENRAKGNRGRESSLLLSIRETWGAREWGGGGGYGCGCVYVCGGRWHLHL